MDDSIQAWNPWWETREVPSYLRGRRRRLTGEVLAAIDMPHVFMLSGIRRSGKTTILYQIIDDLLARGVSPDDILFLNLEDPALGDPLDELIDIHPTNSPGPRRFVFLDEIQTRRDWERSILPRYERKEAIKFMVSGSSSNLLSGEHAALLTGRVLEWMVHPLDLAEYRLFHTPHPESGAPIPVSPESLLKDHYILEGGFPEVQQTPYHARRPLLQQYFSQIISRDVALKGKVDLEMTRRVGIYLAETFARPHTRRALARATGIGSLDTLQKHLEALRRTYVISSITQMTPSPKPTVRESSPFKVYWTDIGLRNSLVRNPGTDTGRRAENVVAMALLKHHQKVEFWLDLEKRVEVDFVVTRGDGKISAFQVWYDEHGDTGSLENIPEREFDGFRALRGKIPANRLAAFTILTARAEGESEEIQVEPLASWLMSAGDSNALAAFGARAE